MVMVGQPMDTVKVKMQTFGHLYSGVVQCARCHASLLKNTHQPTSSLGRPWPVRALGGDSMQAPALP